VEERLIGSFLANSNLRLSIDRSQCVVVTGNSIVLWTRFKGFDSLNLRKAEFPIGET
jgi:hypothetical protein